MPPLTTLLEIVGVVAVTLVGGFYWARYENERMTFEVLRAIHRLSERYKNGD